MIRNNSRSDSKHLLNTTFRNIILATTFIMATAGATHAADIIAPTSVQTDIQDQQRWRVIFSPYVWGASLTGKAGLLGLNTNVDVPFKDILENLDMSFMGNIEVTNGTYGVYFDGQYTKTSQDADIRDEQLDMDIKSTTLSGGVYYRLYEQQLEGTTLFGRQRVFAIEPTVGVRWTQIKAQVNVGPYSASRKADWTDPFIGTRVFYDINDRWNIFAEADIGGFGAGTKLSANGQIYLGYRTLIFDVPTTWRVGYRALYQDYRDNDSVEKFKYDVTQHGPVIGLSVQF
ncbi:hypothetical protein [Brucella rhizosphaerae]|nr:hypothetical protein [Brucella rhizosphaerae]